MIGAASWLLLVQLCLEKLQEISGAAVFFVVTQAAGEQPDISSAVQIKSLITTRAYKEQVLLS